MVLTGTFSKGGLKRKRSKFARPFSELGVETGTQLVFTPVQGRSAFWSAAIHRRFPWNGPNCHATPPHRRKAAMNRRTPKRSLRFAWSALEIGTVKGTVKGSELFSDPIHLQLT